MDKALQILLITSTGLLGSNLYKVLVQKRYEVIGTYFRHRDENASLYVDITDNRSLRGAFLKTKPKTVILDAALTNVDYCQGHQDEAYAINVEGCQKVVSLCREYNAKLVFFSTDYIFDGEKGPYTEEDIPHPICYYGRTKLEAEQLIRNSLKDFLIVRTTVVFGNEKQQKNFVFGLINSLKNGLIKKVPVDQIGSPTYVFNLAQVVEELLHKNKTGVYNVAGSDVIDRYSFALKICSEFGLDQRLVIPVFTKELNQKAKRPLNAGLKIDRIAKVIDTAIMGAAEGLRLFRKELGI